MKKKLVVAILVLNVLGMGTIRAQGRRPIQGEKNSEMRMEKKMDKLSQELGLSGEQQMQVQAIFAESQIEMQGIQEQYPSLQLAKEEMKQITVEVDKLNKTILSDRLLKMEFNKWVLKNIKQYNSYLEPQNLKIISSLQNRGFFPSLWSSKKRKYLLNLTRCEAHREVLISILKNENSNT